MKFVELENEAVFLYNKVMFIKCKVRNNPPRQYNAVSFDGEGWYFEKDDEVKDGEL